ncbi:hypothetical protein BCR37DRAFT_385495 [Protomyces lactucae-debilis]|uniref:Uncharacterized protein n=1 Tax=Protomyces lactucae-debilis TaxID=2754530 RepID=A0A1Y2FT04_PROLT|nr:uncharacterized protein BCR37DRAFT_385495 [Protomyces lactucae-debilis]ORY87069.1 hypothetical protein BCR37DRAFT_385495 [Protomyces lactucae-debilis]
MRTLTLMSLLIVSTSLLLLSLTSIVLHQPAAAAPVRPTKASSKSRTATGPFSGNSIGSSSTVNVNPIAEPQWEKDYWPVQDKTDRTFYDAKFSLTSVTSEVFPDCTDVESVSEAEQDLECFSRCNNSRTSYANAFVNDIMLRNVFRYSTLCLQDTAIHIEDQNFKHYSRLNKRVCSWQCTCKIFHVIENIRMPQFSLNGQVYELSPEKSQSYWQSFFWPYKVGSRCTVDDIQQRYLGARPAREGSVEAQSKLISPTWQRRCEDILQKRKAVSQKYIEEQKSKRCKCERRPGTKAHQYLPNYCIPGKLVDKSQKPGIPQNVSTENQQMCPWTPIMNPLDGNAAQSSGSGQMPSTLSHYPQSSHQAAAAESSHRLTYEEQMILWSREFTKFMSLFPNDQGVPEHMNHGPAGPQCPPYNPLNYLQAYGQCQSTPITGESSGQGNPSQHYDHTAVQQRLEAQNGQQCNDYWPDWPQYDQDDVDGSDDGNGKNNRPGAYI